MPCRDYQSDVPDFREQRDRLARIACKALTELERQGSADFLLLQDEEVRKWWEQHKIDDAKAAEKE